MREALLQTDLTLRSSIWKSLESLKVWWLGTGIEINELEHETDRRPQSYIPPKWLTPCLLPYFPMPIAIVILWAAYITQRLHYPPIHALQFLKLGSSYGAQCHPSQEREARHPETLQLHWLPLPSGCPVSISPTVPTHTHTYSHIDIHKYITGIPFLLHSLVGKGFLPIYLHPTNFLLWSHPKEGVPQSKAPT